MPRKRPTTKLDIIGNLDLSPENVVGDYIESKQQDKLFIKPPIWDVPGDSIELLSIQNEREYLEMLKLQDEMLENAKRQRIINTNRINEMYKVQSELRERFISVNNFIKDCDDKKHTAENKIVVEKKTQQKLEEEINKYQKSIDELGEFRNVLMETVKQFEPYEAVIKDVVEQSDILKSVKDCMARCDALMLAQVEISELEQEKIKQIEEMRKNMVKVTNDAALTVLGLNNDLAELERSYNKGRAESLKWEKIMATTKDCIAENELTRERILDAIQQMYKLLCRRRGIDASLKRSDIQEQLDFIKYEIEILQHIVNVSKNYKDQTH